jgi:23S rRNA (cytidine1920-2'-O)/16S rRNA (cytidine1409-2'-O)-methyltransferase
VVRDDAARQRAVDKIRDFALRLGWNWGGVVDSPVAGADGNRELLCLLKP